MITNATTSIRRMNTNIYEVINTMNYITTANLKDAIPVGHEDSQNSPGFHHLIHAIPGRPRALRAMDQKGAPPKRGNLGTDGSHRKEGLAYGPVTRGAPVRSLWSNDR
jgi:hypothetical protein